MLERSSGKELISCLGAFGWGLGYPLPLQRAALGIGGCLALAPCSQSYAPADLRPGEAACLLGGLEQAVTWLLCLSGDPGLMWSVVWLSPKLLLDSDPQATPAAMCTPQEMGVFRAPSAGRKKPVLKLSDPGSYLNSRSLRLDV